MNKLTITLFLFLISASIQGQDAMKGTIKIKKPVEETVLIPKIANKNGGAITIRELISAQGIIVNNKYIVIAFDMLINVGGVQIARGAEGNQITTEMKKYIRNTRKGQRIYFKNIRCIGPNGVMRMLSSMTFEISNMDDKNSNFFINVK